MHKRKIDTIATAISADFTVQQLIDLDLANAPPFSTAWDPLQIAARRLRCESLEIEYYVGGFRRLASDLN